MPVTTSAAVYGTGIRRVMSATAVAITTSRMTMSGWDIRAKLRRKEIAVSSWGRESSPVRMRNPFRPTAPAPVAEPIHAEVFGVERLEQHAESLASAQPVRRDRGWARRLLSRVADNARVLREAYQVLAAGARDGQPVTPAAEWLIENFHVIDEQLREIRDDLPPGFYRELPKLADGPLAGYPQVYGIAWAFVAHTDSRFDLEMLRRFVRAYQRVQVLSIGELWAVAITLRIVLVENVRRLAEEILASRAAREEADRLVDDLLGVGARTSDEAMADLRRYERAPLRHGVLRADDRATARPGSGRHAGAAVVVGRLAAQATDPGRHGAGRAAAAGRHHGDNPQRHHQHAADVGARLGRLLRERQPGG